MQNSSALKQKYLNRKKNKIKTSTSKKVIFTVYFVLACVFSVYCLFPLFWAFYNSLKTVEEYYTSTLALPQTWDFSYYSKIFKSFTVGRYGFWDMAWNSIWMAFGSQFLNLLASVLVAYPLARYDFPAKGFFYGIIIFRITIPIVGGGAAGYKLMLNLNMINNPLNYSLQWFTGFDMQALIVYGYFKNISKEYSEAAFIDGANKLTVLFKIVLPQAWPCLIALYISGVKGVWSNYTNSMLYLQKYPNLGYGIYLLQDEASFLEGGVPMYYGAILLSALVPITLFAFGQKSMLTNMSVGGLKG